MSQRPGPEAIVIGSGPNGLAAAITLARAGKSVHVLEAKDSIGGGMRTLPLTLPGLMHDMCSAVHPLGIASPFMRSLPLADYGVQWIESPKALAHPFDDGSVVLVDRDIDVTAAQFGADRTAYRRLMRPLVSQWQQIISQILGPFPWPPRHVLALARFGLLALQSARGLATRWFTDERARALFAGMAAHSILPLEQPATAAFGLVLGMLSHAVGWPLVRGGTQKLADAMSGYLQALGGAVITKQPVSSADELSSALTLYDVTPRQLLAIAGARLPQAYQRQLSRYRYGPGIFKLDLACDAPIPWNNSTCAQAATVHLGGSLDEIAAAERAVWQGVHPARPFVLLVQSSLFDAARAPAGQHTVWAYCHVPNGSMMDMTSRIEAQIERFASGFRTHVLARAQHNCAQMEQYNANYIGGDINGGVQDLRQLFTRPVPRWSPYTTPVRGMYLCSSSTPPGGGVHGMCGYHAARAALRARL